MPAAPAPLQTSRVVLISRSGQLHRVDHPGYCDDRSAVLIVMKDRNIHQFAQALFDDEAFRRLDIFEIDAAEGRPQKLHGIDELLRVFGADFEVDRVDVREALEQNGLALHHRLRRQRAEIAETQDRGAVGDNRDHVAFDGVIEGPRGILRDGEHRHRDARRIGERQIALRRHRLRRLDGELARPALRVELQRLLIGEGRAFRATLGLLGHCFSGVPASQQGAGP